MWISWCGIPPDIQWKCQKASRTSIHTVGWGGENIEFVARDLTSAQVYDCCVVPWEWKLYWVRNCHRGKQESPSTCPKLLIINPNCHHQHKRQKQKFISEILFPPSSSSRVRKRANWLKSAPSSILQNCPPNYGHKYSTLVHNQVKWQ